MFGVSFTFTISEEKLRSGRKSTKIQRLLTFARFSCVLYKSEFVWCNTNWTDKMIKLHVGQLSNVYLLQNIWNWLFFYFFRFTHDDDNYTKSVRQFEENLNPFEFPATARSSKGSRFYAKIHLQSENQLCCPPKNDWTGEHFAISGRKPTGGKHRRFEGF